MTQPRVVPLEEVERLLGRAIDETKRIGQQEIQQAIRETLRSVAASMTDTAVHFRSADGERALIGFAQTLQIIADHVEKHGADTPIMNTGTTQF